MKLGLSCIMSLPVKTILISLIVGMFLFMSDKKLIAQDSSTKLNMLEIVISNLIARVEVLEKRVSELEKGRGVSSGILKQQKKEIADKEPAKFLSMSGFEDIGRGFFTKNVRFNQFGNNVLFTGEMANKSDKNYRFAKFKLEIYDDKDLLIKEEEFTIPDIPKDTTRNFEAMLLGIEISLIHRYVIKGVD